MEKEQLIKKELNKLKRIYKSIAGNRYKLLEGAIENAAYMRVTLKELADQADDSGSAELLKQYNALIRNYNATIKVLDAALPASEPRKDKFAAFMEDEE